MFGIFLTVDCKIVVDEPASWDGPTGAKLLKGMNEPASGPANARASAPGRTTGYQYDPSYELRLLHQKEG